MLVVDHVIAAAADMSADITTDGVVLDHIRSLSVQCSWTGSTPVGSLRLQASNDGTVYSDITSSIVTVNGNGDILYNLSDIGYSRIRVFYDRASGSGSMRITINGKDF